MSTARLSPPGTRHEVWQFFAARKHWGLSFSPDGIEVVFISNAAGRGDLWRVRTSGGWPFQLTRTEDRIMRARWSPTEPVILFASDKAGDEQFQLFLVSALGGPPEAIASSVAGTVVTESWSPDGKRIAFTSNREDPTRMITYLYHLETKRLQRLYAPTDQEFVINFSPDGRRLQLFRFLNNHRSEIVVLDIESGKVFQVTPAGAEARCFDGVWSPDGNYLYIRTDLERDHLGIARFHVETGTKEWLVEGRWDIDELALSPDGEYLAYTTNRDGVHGLSLMDLADGESDPLFVLPEGFVGDLHQAQPMIAFSPLGGHLAFYLQEHHSAGDLWIYDLGHGELRRVTHSEMGGLPARHFRRPVHVRLTASDEMAFSAQLYLPRGASASKPASAIIMIHGGPNQQVVRRYYAHYQYFLDQGYALLAPNFRGSTGYGRRFAQLADGDWGGGPLLDILASHEYLKTIPEVDAGRTALYGVSYGGYLALRAATKAPERWRAVIDVFGPSNLLDFIATAPAWWGESLYRMVGHPERDHDKLVAQSPLHDAHLIKAPLLVVQGANDTRVVPAESEQMVARLRQAGRHVDYMLIPDEGHGFSKIANELRVYEAAARFLDTHLGHAPR